MKQWHCIWCDHPHDTAEQANQCCDDPDDGQQYEHTNKQPISSQQDSE